LEEATPQAAPLDTTHGNSRRALILRMGVGDGRMRRAYTIGKPTIARRLVYVWPKRDIPFLAATYGDEYWVRNIYGRLHSYAVIEFIVLAIGLLVSAAAV